MRALSMIGVLVLMPCLAFAQHGPGGNFDLFKTPYAQFPGGLDIPPPNRQAVAPPFLDSPGGTSHAAPPMLIAPARSAVIYNKSSVSMHFNVGGQEIELAPNTAKTIDLPDGVSEVPLVYSIAGQQKQITLRAGRSYTLNVDVARREIVSQ